MNPLILNRDFSHPADGWYQIEPKGEHPNRAAGIVQVIDDEAAQSIVNRFNADAKAGTLRHGNEMLIDHEHFKDQPDQETRAYGWLTQLQNRADGIYGQIRWTKTGKEAVDGGDYRFFSTEYEPNDLKQLQSPIENRKSEMQRVRPLRLDGLSLTNMNNNRGQKPITNRTSRSATMPVAPADGMCPDCRVKLVPDPDGDMDGGDVTCPQCKKDFVEPRGSAASNQKPKNRTNTMKSIAQKLGLAAEASEDAILAEVTKIINRGDITAADLITLRAEHKAFGEQNQTLLGEQVDALLDAHGVKEEKVRNRLKPVITTMKNREERVAALVDFGFKPLDPKAEKGNGRVINRGAGKAESADADTAVDEKDLAGKITNRAQELKGAAPARSFDSCWNQAKRELTK